MASQFLNTSSTAKKYARSLYSGCFLTAARALASRSRGARPTAVSARPFTSGHGVASGFCNWKSSAVSARERGPCAIHQPNRDVASADSPESLRGSARAHPAGECASTAAIEPIPRLARASSKSLRSRDRRLCGTRLSLDPAHWEDLLPGDAP
jgi:hypothetical protein